MVQVLNNSIAKMSSTMSPFSNLTGKTTFQIIRISVVLKKSLIHSGWEDIVFTSIP